MKARAALLVAFAACAGAPPVAVVDHAPQRLLCEYVDTPLGIDVDRPRLSWWGGDPARGAVQSAWQVLAATAPELLQPGTADLWDSGRVVGERQLHVDWDGPRLAPALRVYWTVRTWDGAGRASAFAAPTWFETGLAAGEPWGASWIGDGAPLPSGADAFADRPAPWLRRGFRLDGAVRRARLYVAGLGWHAVWLNGQRVGDHRLDPPWVAFDRLVPYAVHDVTALLGDGDNAIAVLLGNGWFAPTPLQLWGRLDLRRVLPSGAPRLCCRLDVDYADGRRTQVTSDGQWRTAGSHVVRNDVYLGERHDARRAVDGVAMAGFDDSAWAPAVELDPPRGALRWLALPPVRAVHELAPRQIRTIRPGVHVVDFGQNFAGVVRLVVDAPRDREIVLRFAEELHGDGSLDPTSTLAAGVDGPGKGGPGAPDVAWQEDRFVCAGGGGEVFEPLFTWHGGRYVEITGLPAAPAPRDVTGVVLQTDVAEVASFACSDPLLDRVRELSLWSLRGNALSVLSDCPARERFGYGGDMVASADAWLAHFDTATLHAKAVDDFARAARADGGLPECAPDVGIHDGGLTADSGPLGWMFAHPLLAWRAYEHCGDRRLLERNYATLVRLVEFCRRRIPDHVTAACLGDHGNDGLDPVPVHATVIWYRMLRIAADTAVVLGRDADARRFLQWANEVRAEFAAWVDATTGVVVVPTQTSQAIALAHGLVPARLRDEAFAVLLERIAGAGDRFTTGMFATGDLLRALGDAGRDDLALRMVRSRDERGYGHFVDQGATTLWEHWTRKPGWSRNHVLYTAVSAWLQRAVLGIRQADGSVAWRHVEIAPTLAGELTWARGHLDTVRGRIVCAWQRTGDRLRLDVEIPPNAQAVVRVPMLGSAQRSVWEGDTPIVQRGVPLRSESGCDVRAVDARFCAVHVGAGRYRFEVR